MTNVNMIFNARNNAIKFLNDNSTVVIEARSRSVRVEGLKIIAPKQML